MATISAAQWFSHDSGYTCETIKVEVIALYYQGYFAPDKLPSDVIVKAIPVDEEREKIAAQGPGVLRWLREGGIHPVMIDYHGIRN